MKISLQHVDHIYQEGGVSETAALRDVDLTVDEGELVAVIGHGGSGKSTLALLMAGLYEPTSGQVELTGSKDPEHPFRSVGLVFQYPEQQLFGESVFEEVAFGARNQGVAEDYLPVKVREALEQVGLDPDVMWYRSPFSLSGGQKRRVCIAGVLVMDPQLIILDEPTAGLDEGGRKWIAQLVRRLNEEGRTVVWITHNMAEAAEVARRVIVLKEGRVLLDGPPQEVFSEEETLMTAHLTPPPAARLVRELRRRGWDIEASAVTVEGAAQEILAHLQSSSGKEGGHA
ncbi:MAG: energy-coupling factor transporter ATPase [Firmicutes bacterium]|nr:energy-coupling factor transporter ATPase [Bacillota bacterium]